MKIFLAAPLTTYQSLLNATAELSTVAHVFYEKTAGSPVTVARALILFESRDFYIEWDLSANSGATKPTETQFLTDYPAAVECYTNGIAY